ncbi:uncharacterized protein LOC119834273 [Zerene cesonia]|uniref:uncharacterized protein LOC119834273 n=1 Tax=Zerene cesonia TaxID=33412 RepID=UPI0018E54B17|nr:uncharacterized protein LOC119834273 [Zerene cesonia]
MAEDTRPTPFNLITFLPYACKQLEASFDVKIETRILEEYVSAQEKSKKTNRDKSIMQNASPTLMSPDKIESPVVFLSDDQDLEIVCICAVCDTAGRLVEMLFQRTNIPRLLLKVITMCIPYQPYLNKISIRWCTIDGYTLHEITNCLPQSHITEICLNDSPVLQRNYHLLLEYQTQLKCLSLDRCELEDGDCAAIAAKLVYRLPASRSLCVLSLASNSISDEGATALATMLRSNRQLRYLNLSGNLITNTGALAIFHSLMEFSMTYEEIISKRTRNIQYIRLQKEVYTKCYNELITTFQSRKSIDERSTGRKKIMPAPARAQRTALVSSRPSTADNVALKAEMMTLELIGAYNDPFCDSDTVHKNEYLYSIGNMSLSYLNLSHNYLDHCSIMKLVEVMRYQSNLPKKSQSGLVRFVIEGNPLPLCSRELDALQDLADTAGANRLGRINKSEKFKGKLR